MTPNQPRYRYLLTAFSLFMMVSVLFMSDSRSSHAEGPSLSPGGQRIEAESESIIRQGSWEIYPAEAASGGAYLASSGHSSDDTLLLNFEGTAITVVYVAHPSFGTMVIEVDGVVLRSVMTHQETTAFQQTTTIDYLSEGPHQLRVYASEGAIALDTFIVSGTGSEQGPAGLDMPEALLPPPSLARAQDGDESPGVNDTSSYMIGKVLVNVFLVESTYSGSGAESWTAAEVNQVTAQINASLHWWEATAANYGLADGLLKFQAVYHTPFNAAGNIVRVNSSEPIHLPSYTHQGQWIAPLLQNLGFKGATPNNYFGQVAQYNHQQRLAAQTDWAFTIFVVDSSADADGRFSDGRFAYAYLNGPFSVMTYDNGNWGIGRMAMITAHETGHIFGALDEYASSGCSTSQTHGYLVIPHSNCENGGTGQVSLMRGPDSMTQAYNSHQTSTSHRQAIGWRDSDGDGILDPLDVVDSGLQDAALSVENGQVEFGNKQARASGWRYQGQTAWMTNSGKYRPISINTLHNIEYQLNKAGWLPVTHLSAPYGQAQEDYTFSVEVGSGVHTLQVRVLDRFGNSHTSPLKVITYHSPVFMAPLAEQYTGNLTYRWAGLPEADYYHLKVTNDSGLLFEQWYSSGAVCSAVQCSARPALHLVDGHYTWHLELWDNESASVATIGEAGFRVTSPQQTTPRTPATVNSPSFDLKWLPTGAGETHYQVYVGDGGSNYVMDWFAATDVCTSGQCAVSSGDFDTVLPNGAYVWYMRTGGPVGAGNWVGPQAFDLQVNLPGVVQKQAPAPNAVLDSSQLHFTWAPAANASLYQLYLDGPATNGPGLHSITAAEAGCSSGTCQAVIEVDANGQYTWYLSAGSSGGYGPWSAANSAVDGWGAESFTVLEAAPGPIGTLAPAQNASFSSGSLHFRWQHDTRATAYEFYLAGPQGYQHHRVYDTAELACSSVECQLELALHYSGAYQWYLRAQNRTDVGPWSPANSAADSWGVVNFTVQAGVPGVVGRVWPPVEAVLNDNAVDFRWQYDPLATYYEFYLAGPQGTSQHDYYIVGETVACSGRQCRLTLHLPQNGSYSWYLRGGGPGGVGPWSAANSAADGWGVVNFALNTPAPPTAYPVSPPEGTVIDNLAQAQAFTWSATANTTYYNLVWINDDTQQVIGSTWYSAEQAGCLDHQTCQIEVPLAEGRYRWAILTYGPGTISLPAYQAGTTPEARFTVLEDS